MKSQLLLGKKYMRTQCVASYQAPSLVSCSYSYQTTLSPALDVLHHQSRELKGGSGHCFRGTGWTVDMTNEIQARVMIIYFECTWSKAQIESVIIITCSHMSGVAKITALSGDHAHYKLLCTFPSHMHSSVSQLPFWIRVTSYLHAIKVMQCKSFSPNFDYSVCEIVQS